MPHQRGIGALTETRMEGGSDVETWEGSGCSRPKTAAARSLGWEHVWYVQGTERDRCGCSRVFKGKRGLEAGVGTLAITLGELEAFGGLGY